MAVQQGQQREQVSGIQQQVQVQQQVHECRGVGTEGGDQQRTNNSVGGDQQEGVCTMCLGVLQELAGVLQNSSTGIAPASAIGLGAGNHRLSVPDLADRCKEQGEQQQQQQQGLEQQQQQQLQQLEQQEQQSGQQRLKDGKGGALFAAQPIACTTPEGLAKVGKKGA